MTSDNPPQTSSPPPSSMETLETRIIKGIAGAPGVAVGIALVMGEMRAVYTRRHVHTSQMEEELYHPPAGYKVSEAAE